MAESRRLQPADLERPAKKILQRHCKELSHIKIRLQIHCVHETQLWTLLQPHRAQAPSLPQNSTSTSPMARKPIAIDQVVKLIVGAGQASPSPPVGPALGSKGVKSIDFCKVSAPSPLTWSQYGRLLTRLQEFNARTAHITPGIPIPARVTVRPDRSFHFELRTPTTSYLLLQAANVKERKGKVRGAMSPGKESVGEVSLKHIYDIAKIKQSELRLSGLPLDGLCRSVIAQAKTVGVTVIP